METDDEYSEDEGYDVVWCHNCENEIPTANGKCETCNRQRLVKIQEYSIYNTFWQKEFIRKGELVQTKSLQQKDAELCSLARRMLVARSTTTRKKVDISEMVWLSDPPPRSPPPEQIPHKKISKWTDMF
uniref:Uncharacterized protein n=1 Tax=viral metagenome TaxID=1070528 RepID=A0A6C0KD87_9ZZZZ